MAYPSYVGCDLARSINRIRHPLYCPPYTRTELNSEHTHDYIQWLFPIPEASRFNSFAPLLTPAVQAAFANDERLRHHQQRSLDVMLNFGSSSLHVDLA
ncbi:hypothetical protein E8Q34_17915 [Halomonas sp. 15WGF]|nr:hypothetical protein E8Q34_17915 [Halomonas sp. 15WGF]